MSIMNQEDRIYISNIVKNFMLKHLFDMKKEMWDIEEIINRTVEQVRTQVEDKLSKQLDKRLDLQEKKIESILLKINKDNKWAKIK